MKFTIFFFSYLIILIYTSVIWKFTTGLFKMIRQPSVTYPWERSTDRNYNRKHDFAVRTAATATVVASRCRIGSVVDVPLITTWYYSGGLWHVKRNFFPRRFPSAIQIHPRTQYYCVPIVTVNSIVILVSHFGIRPRRSIAIRYDDNNNNTKP